jgi:hypothetical protein
MYRQRLKLTFSRPLSTSHKTRALECHLKSQREVELQILKDLIGKENIEQAEASHCRPSLSSTKGRPGASKGIQRPRVSRRLTGMITTDNGSTKPSSKDHHPSQPRPALASGQFVTAVGNELEDTSFSDSLPEPLPTIEPLLPAAFTEFSADTHNTAFTTLGLETGFYNPCYDSRQPMFPCTMWPQRLLIDDGWCI